MVHDLWQQCMLHTSSVSSASEQKRFLYVQQLVQSKIFLAFFGSNLSLACAFAEALIDASKRTKGARIVVSA